MATSFHSAQRRGFVKGSLAQTYKCRCCKRMTRPTGTGDNDGVELCEDCYELAGEENALSDTGSLYAAPTRVLQCINSVVEKGDDASCWAELKTRAEAAIAAAAAPTPVTTVTVTLEADDLRETLIALRDRRYTLEQERVKYAHLPTVLEIVERQTVRLNAAGAALATAVGEVF